MKKVLWVAALAGSQMPPGVKLLAMTAGKTSAWDLLKQLPAGIDLVHFMAPPEAGIFEGLPCAGLLRAARLRQSILQKAFTGELTGDATYLRDPQAQHVGS